MFEHIVEQAALGWFESLGYDVKRGVDISPGADIPPLRESYTDVVLLPKLKAALRRINPALPEDAIVKAALVITRPRGTSMLQNNLWFHDLLSNGVDVEYQDSAGDLRGDKAKIVDFDNVLLNDFLVVHQLTVQNEKHTRRPDLVVYLNGLPVCVIELKDPTNLHATLWNALDQLNDYKSTIPDLFTYNEILLLSDGDTTRIGTITSGRDRFSPWRSIRDGREPGKSTLETVINELFRRDIFLDYLTHCISFEAQSSGGLVIKKMGGYHQFRAVRSTLESCKLALLPKGDGRGGVVWHTQGSGKSFTMLMLAGALVQDRDLSNPTIVVVTDRNDLDGQLFDTFAHGRGLLKQEPSQASSREDLALKLNRASGGVIFTTIQKFEERLEPLSYRSNIVVLADEAHRSQYGFVKGGARWMREALPNATFVGFTGTPIESSDRVTRAVFGDYVDIYDIRQAVDDNATVKIFYEMRLIKLLPDQQGIQDAEFRLLEAFEAARDGNDLPSDIGIPLEELVGAKQRLQVLASEIISHFDSRSEAIDGKAMIVCMSRQICMDLYDEIIRIRPDWHQDDDGAGEIKVVMDGNVARGTTPDSAARIRYHGRTKNRRDIIAARLKNNSDPLKLVIVCDMWLTGFDCPPLHTMYLDKPLSGHNLMQAIARVNRVFGNKPGGVIVDFLGIADQLKEAVQTYTQAGGEGSPVESIQQQAIPEMRRYFEELADFFSGFERQAFLGSTEAEQLNALTAGADFVLSKEDGKRRFMNMVTGLTKAYALAVPMPETIPVRDHLAFYQSIRAAMRKRLDTEADDLREFDSAAVRQVITSAVSTDGVIDLFAAAGLPDPNVGILSDAFLDGLSSLPQKNLALETLKKLLADQISSREKVNIVQSRTFRDALEQVLTRYSNRAITTAQVIDELIGVAKSIAAVIAQGKASGLSEAEIAFYEALADNESAREILKDEKLKDIARELAESIKKKTSLDWTQRETVRADMRRTIRRLLAKYGYPPVAQESATQLVIRQAELMAAREMYS